MLVEEAKIKAVEVEKKVAGADAFAEQVNELQVFSLQLTYALSFPCQYSVLHACHVQSLPCTLI